MEKDYWVRGAEEGEKKKKKISRKLKIDWPIVRQLPHINFPNLATRKARPILESLQC
jgi:hypothetical protein